MGKARRIALKKRDSYVSPWTGLINDVLYSVMMKLGVIDFVAFSGVCKSWRSFALSNRKMFMASRPPMLMRIHEYKKKSYCFLEDFQRRKFKTIIPHSGGWRKYVGLTCGYLVFYAKKTKDFWLVNPITRHELHFPGFQGSVNYFEFKSILFFSPSISSWLFAILDGNNNKIWFSIAGKRAWNHVSCKDDLRDILFFKGKIYILTFSRETWLYEMILNPNPKLELLKSFGKQDPSYRELVSLGENLSAIYRSPGPKRKEVSPEEKTSGEYAFFLSDNSHGVAIKPESWAVDPLSIYKAYDCFFNNYDETKKGRFFYAEPRQWYFPHCCLNVDLLDV